MASQSRQAFSGEKKRLILGIDVGTTFAGISYCLLEPGKIPEILPVTRFPPQDHIGGDSKVPSILYYDRSGKAQAVGAEAMQESVVEQAETEGWQKAEWFKLHLRPNSSPPISPLPPLPKNKNATEVFADFLRYLFNCAKTYIIDHYQDGSALWVSLANSIEFVLTHPNGWEGEQQAAMRRAAIVAGLIPSNREGRERVHFVTEGEASLNFCILNGLAMGQLKQSKGVMLLDAGGGTIDISAYRLAMTQKGETFEEITRPQCCLFQGSIFVSNRAQDYLQAKLKGSKYEDSVQHICECFDKTTKLKFRNEDEWSYIKFGLPREKDSALNISNGQMKLEGSVVAGFFQESLNTIIAAVITQQRASNFTVSSVLLVGGFGASEWVYLKLKNSLSTLGLEVSRPDSHVFVILIDKGFLEWVLILGRNKAVSDGAVSFYLDHFVTSRVSKETYGVECTALYDPDDSEHVSRSTSKVLNVKGALKVPKKFDSILRKDVRVSETREFRRSYHVMTRTISKLVKINCKILSYRGEDSDPQWLDIDPEQYVTLCTIRADTSQIAKTIKPIQGQRGTYYSFDHDIVLSFGLTELKAQIAWLENGIEQRGPAEILY